MGGPLPAELRSWWARHGAGALTMVAPEWTIVDPHTASLRYVDLRDEAQDERSTSIFREQQLLWNERWLPFVATNGWLAVDLSVSGDAAALRHVSSWDLGGSGYARIVHRSLRAFLGTLMDGYTAGGYRDEFGDAFYDAELNAWRGSGT